MAASLSGLIEELVARRSAAPERVEAALSAALGEGVPEVQLAGLLVALRTCALTPELLAGAARAVRAHARPLACARAPLVDTCGTGGDGAGTFNVSTAAALVVASAGGAVAKHGNRGVSSKSGSADVLAALGVSIELSPEAAAELLDSTGFAFLFAPLYHPAMRRVAPVRQSLGIRTLFNLIGPLANPAGARHQLVGVYASELTETLARALRLLGSTRALVVHCDGLDELGLHAPTRGHLLAGGAVTPFELDPRELGVARAPLAALAADGAHASAAMVRAALAGERGAPLEAVALNAGAALFAAELAPDVATGRACALEELRSGRAAALLDEVARRSSSLAAEARA